MARRRRSAKKSRKSSRRRRRNGAGLGRTAFLALMAKGKARKAGKRRKTKSVKRRKTSRKAKRSTSGKRIRPVIISRAGKHYRPRRSKYFKTARRVNGRRRRANGAAGKLLSTVKGMFKVPSLLRYASIGGGIFGGTLLSKLLNTGLVPFTSIALPASITSTLAKVRPAHGLIHILAGTVIASKARNKHIKDAALGLAALGSFDLLMQVLAMAGMKNLPTFSGMNIDLRGMSQYAGMSYPGSLYGKMPTQAGMNVDLRGRRTRAMAGLNVDLLGESRHRDAESSHLADNINDMIS